MIDDSVILTFDGAVIVGLFVFYSFLINLAGRIEHTGKDYKKEYVNISNALFYFAIVQIVFSISAFFALFGVSAFATWMSALGLMSLMIGFLLFAFTDLLVERHELPKRE